MAGVSHLHTSQPMSGRAETETDAKEESPVPLLITVPLFSLMGMAD